jgi:hypothetical protein
VSSEQEASPNLAGYAAARGLSHRVSSLGLPKATQLLRHGFMNEVPSLVRGDLPGGLTDAWLAQVDYVYAGRNDLKRRYFTIVLIQAPESIGFAERVLCHDRALSELDMANPDAGREVVELDDRAVRLESEDFLRRYSLFTDNDQDELAVWRLFAPSLIDWLTVDAPTGFSFELQDGALCCFVPGTLAAEEELDELCEASARVFREVARVGGASGSRSPAEEGSRRSRIEQELAEHPFDSPPKSVKAAAKKFGRGPFIGDEAWKLGAESFFREHSRAAGLEWIETSAFRASHMETFLPGVLGHAAKGRLNDAGAESFLVLTDSEDFDGMGWSVLIADIRSPADLLGIRDAPRGISAERGEVKASTDGRAVILTTLDGGSQGRTAKELQAFLAECRSLLA